MPVAAPGAVVWRTRSELSFLFLSNQESVVSEVIEYKSWVCLICGWIYNEEEGLPDEGIAAGTRFDDIPDDWRCPLCDVGKADFVVVEF
jgi:rubredoxin